MGYDNHDDDGLDVIISSFSDVCEKMMMMMMMKSLVLGCDATTFDQIKHGSRCNDL